MTIVNHSIIPSPSVVHNLLSNFFDSLVLSAGPLRIGSPVSLSDAQLYRESSQVESENS